MLSGRTVLIVEDELLVALDLQDQVEEVGGQAVVVRNLANALQQVGDGDFDVALVDCHLGKLTAAPLLQRLVERRIPFIIHSGAAESRHLVRWPSAATVSKPAPAEKIRHALQAALPTVA